MRLWVMVYRYQQDVVVFAMMARYHDEVLEVAKKLLGDVEQEEFKERFLGAFPVQIPDGFELAPAGTRIALVNAQRRGSSKC